MKLRIYNSKLIIQNYLAVLILFAFIILAVIYSIVTPIFEAGDESRHYAVVKYMADTGHLINQNAPDIQRIQHHWSHEGNQPPLYYGLAAALTFWIDTGSWDDTFWYNPHATIGNPLRPDNKNIAIHPPAESWPWRNHALAVHLIRFLSIAMATVTVLACYAIALSLFKGNRWLAAGAMAITAFNPMFIFISASVNNDNAVIMFVTLAIWLMVQLTINNEQLTKKHLLMYAAFLGVMIGLGTLSKLYAIGLLPIAAFIFIWITYKQLSIINYQLSITNYISLRTAFPSILTLTIIFLAVAGWFYLRNALLYNGDVLALQIMRDTAGQRQEVPSLATLRAEFQGFRIAYWALFGGVNILADSWMYTVLDIVSLIAALGAITFIAFWIYDLRFTTKYPLGIYALRATQHSTPNIHHSSFIIHHSPQFSLPAFTLLLSWYLIMIAGFILWNLTQPAGQGRLLYPAIAAISALGMLGLTWWLPRRAQKIVATLVTIGLFLFAAASPFLYIAPAYAKPPILTEADLPPDLQPVNFTYDGAMRLIGYRLQTDTARPAETLPISLYWQLLQPTDLNYSIFIHLLGRDRQVIGQIDSYPGGGAWPTTLLSPGDIVAGHYRVPIAPEAEFNHAPTRIRIAAGIYDYREAGRPGRPAVNASGEPVEPVIATAKLIPWQWPQPEPADRPINFFDKATLVSYHLADDQQSITLTWQVEDYFDADYTVFLQAWDADTGQYVTGFDGPPVQGNYPTSLWSPGEIIVDRHSLDLSQLAPGGYNLLAGLYNPNTGERLPAFGPDGPLPDYAVNVGRLQITAPEMGSNE